MEFIIWYFIPLVICLIVSWIMQINESERGVNNTFFGIIGIIPFANIVLALFFILEFLSWIVFEIIKLPTTIKQYIKNRNR